MPKAQKISLVSSDDSAVVSEAVHVSDRHYFSILHLWSTFTFARRCQEREDSLIGVTAYDAEHRSLAISSVLSAVAFLEGLSNEVFQDAADRDQGVYTSPHIVSFSDETVALYSAFWNAKKNGESYGRVLDKFQIALTLAGKPRFNKGCNPYQDAQYLITLRNDLVHARPKSRVHGEPDTKHDHGLAKRFKSNRLMENAGSNPWYPDKCLGAGCARWAAESAKRLADEWAVQLGLQAFYLQDDLPSLTEQ